MSLLACAQDFDAFLPPTDAGALDTASKDSTALDSASQDAKADVTFMDVVTMDAPVSVCADGMKNGNETDTDCGGNQCPKCPHGKKCMKNMDCESNHCNNDTCAP
jgi:hypothetical protein